MLEQNTHEAEKQGELLEQNTPLETDDNINEQYKETKRHFGTEYTTSVMLMGDTGKQRDIFEQNTPQADDNVNDRHSETRRQVGK